MRPRPSIKNLLKNERGATALGYSLIAALIAVATIGATTAMSDDKNSTSGKTAPETGSTNN